MPEQAKGAHGPELQCDDVKKLKVEMDGLKKHVDEIHYQVKEQALELADIKEFQGGTKVYVVEIKDQLNRLEERLFTFMGDLVKNLTRKEETETVAEARKEEALAATQAKLATEKWAKGLNTLKDIIKLLAAAVVGYLASKGVTKIMLTNIGLVEYAKKALSEKWGYVWGTFGQLLTAAIFQAKLKQYPDGVGKYKDFIAKTWVGRKTTDCVGLIKSYCWYRDGKIIYDAKTDIDANKMYNLAKEKGLIGSIPEIPGLCVWKQSHIGVYIGCGQVIEAAGTMKGVIKTPLKGKGATPWTHWLKCPFITYEEPVKQPTAYELAVDAALAAGLITDKVYWLKILKGEEVINLCYLRQAFANAKGLRRR